MPAPSPSSCGTRDERPSAALIDEDSSLTFSLPFAAGDVRGAVQIMRADIHPKYHNVLVHCACGNTFETRSTRPEIRVDVCGACHPYYTGAQKFVDTAGRVDKFRRRYARGGSTPAPQSGPSS